MSKRSVAAKFQSGAVLFFVLFLMFFTPVFAGQMIINEDFDTLGNWLPVFFPKIKRHSEYMIQAEGDNHILVARSNASASGLRYIREFDVYEYPVMQWRWKIDNVYEHGDVEKKSGDDYPLRLYVMFRYDPEKAGIKDRIVYGLAKAVYGEYPPLSTINYIWANKKHAQAVYPSPYTDKAKLIIVRSGKADAGVWKEEEANIVEDYRRAFGDFPPAMATLAIMNDSDNTGESSVSYLDYVRVLRQE